MRAEVFIGILLPLLGTSLGAACVFLWKAGTINKIEKTLTGFAAGVMLAASVWSLIIPAIEQNASQGFFAVVPVLIGFWAGILFLCMLDWKIGNTFIEKQKEGKSIWMLVIAVTLHNLPEGMAVGAVYAAYQSGSTGISLIEAFVLSIGIAVQNIPEGAIVSMPVYGMNRSKGKGFLSGFLSGVIEPVGAVLMILFLKFLFPILPGILGLAAGSMVYVVVKELIPQTITEKSSYWGLWMFSIGFSIMMLLDNCF